MDYFYSNPFNILLFSKLFFFSSVVSVGGDGLCSEIINGMIHIKDDVHQGRKNKKDKGLMLGIIPAGKSWQLDDQMFRP